ncbi:nitroreductase family protein [Anaerosporobacter sp.]
MREAIEKRIARRSFEKKPLTLEEQNKIREMISVANMLSGLSMEFVEDGSKAFESLKKSYGLFTNVRSLILMKGKKEDENLHEKIGYYGEDIVLNVTDMELGTCWVGGTFDKESFSVLNEEEIVCVILVGKVEKQTMKEKMIRAASSKKRKSIEQRLESSVQIPNWIANGMEAVRLAPSAKNSQKVMFHYDGQILTIDVVDDYVMDLIDLGIAKKHFEIETVGKFDLGNGAAFQVR